jgi:hypothetical protein
MKKVIRLTESDLIRLVKRVIKEQATLPTGPTPEQNEKELRKLLMDNGFTNPEGTDNRFLTKFKGEEEFMIYFHNTGDEPNTISILISDPSEATIKALRLQKNPYNDTYRPMGPSNYSYANDGRTEKPVPFKDTESKWRVQAIINYTK